MFQAGEGGGLTDLEGGTFDFLDRQLELVRSEFPEVRFATLSEAVADYLDYASPRLQALFRPETERADEMNGETVYRYSIRLLGKNIPVDKERPARVALSLPAYFDLGRVKAVQIVQGNNRLVEFDALSPGIYSVEFSLTGRKPEPELFIRCAQDCLFSFEDLYPE